MRHDNWSEKLHAYIDAMRDVPFEWGVNDCARFCAGAIEAMTGERLMPEVDSEDYQSAEQVRPVVDGILGQPVSTLEARRGDIAMTESGSLGVVLGSRVATPTSTGVRFAPLSGYVCAWRVG